MARLMSAVVAFGESSDSRLLKDEALMLNKGEFEKVLWVAFEIKSQAKFHVSMLLGDVPRL